MNQDATRKQLASDPYNPRLHLELARAYLDEGDDDKAREVVVRRRHMASDDPEVHRGWAEVCEELGMARQARESYETALRIAPGDADTLYRLARLLADVGHYERSLHHLRQALAHNPRHKAARELLSRNYRALGLQGQAEALSARPAEAARAAGPRYFPPAVSEEEAGAFQRLFAGREVGHALQKVDAASGRIFYEYQQGPLGLELVRSHILGSITLGAYALRSDNTVHYGAISVRLARRTLEANLKNKGYLHHLTEQAKTHALALGGAARDLSLRAYVEDSGAFEYRLWFFFEEPVHFLKVKRFLGQFLEAGPPPSMGALAVEALAATRPVGVGWVERALMLPLGIHRATMRRSLFLDENGVPHEIQLKFLRRIRPNRPAALSLPHLRAGVPAQMRKTGPGALPHPARVLRDNCPVLSELIGRALSARVLRREEKVILFYTLGLVDPGGDSLHQVLEPCPDYAFHKVQKQLSRLRPNPISCLRIRRMIPEITASVVCNCTFDLRGGKYPSPVLHLNPHLVPTAEELAVPGDMHLREAARRYANLRRQVEEINTALARLEGIIARHMTRKGIDQVWVEEVILRCIDEGGQTRWLLERRS